jgi:hypothetical protein
MRARGLPLGFDRESSEACPFMLGFDRESSETVRSSGEQWHGGEAEDGSPAARPRRCSSRPRGLAAEPHGTRPVRAA